MVTIKQTSYGGVVVRRNGTEWETAICGLNYPPTWRLPKGTPEDGEACEETAIREVQEETGLEVQIEDYIGSVTYQFTSKPTKRYKAGVMYDKRVEFYLMSAIGGDIADHDKEFDTVRWASFEKANWYLSFPTEKGILRKAFDNEIFND